MLIPKLLLFQKTISVPKNICVPKKNLATNVVSQNCLDLFIYIFYLFMGRRGGWWGSGEGAWSGADKILEDKKKIGGGGRSLDPIFFCMNLLVEIRL